MKTIEAKNYKSRSELEAEIEKLVGRTTEKKIDFTVSGTREELAHLGLSDLSKVWGISCVIIDTPSVTTGVHVKPFRGEIFKGGINLNKNG